MKRKAAILALVLVVVLTLAVALTACNGVKNTAKLTEGLEAADTRTVVNDRLSAIASDITSASINGYGVVMWQDYDASAGTTYYYLPLGSSSPITSSTPFSFVSPYGCGIYYTASSDGYSYYDANGYLRDDEASLSVSGGQLTFSDGTVYNVVKGVAITDGDPFSVSYEEAGDADIVTSNYRIVGSKIYDKSGNFVRSFDINALCEIPETAIDTTVKWTIEDYIYVQYTYALPLDAKKYDYAEGLGKAKLVTKRYDIKKDKVKEIKNFDYVVKDVFAPLTDRATGDEMRPTEYAVLSVAEIGKDKQRGQFYIQTFKKNLGIYVNLQKLMPGATEISLYGDNVILASDSTGETAVFDGKDEIASFIPADSLTSVNGGAYRYGDSYYNFAGGHIYTLGSNERVLNTSANGVLWVADASSYSSMTVKAINLANNSTTTYTVAYSVYESLSGNFNYLPVVNGSAVDVIDTDTGNVIISGISDTASLYVSSNGDYRLIRVTENGISEFYRYGIVEKEA